jgi:hypothetical protein
VENSGERPNVVIGTHSYAPVLLTEAHMIEQTAPRSQTPEKQVRMPRRADAENDASGSPVQFALTRPENVR